VEAAIRDRVLKTLYDETILEEPGLEANRALFITPVFI
jgi:hypothetical protein